MPGVFSESDFSYRTGEPCLGRAWDLGKAESRAKTSLGWDDAFGQGIA